ncbi:hypothetical protein Dimus_009234 [Dionaea muscipula]
MDNIREEWSLEEGLILPNGDRGNRHGLITKKSEPAGMVIGDDQPSLLREFMANFYRVMFGTKLCVLLPAFPLAIAAHHYNLARPWIFTLSLLGLAPLAERISFLTEQIAYYTGPTVGGLMNATCGNATELIIAILALYRGKMHVLKYSLLGSILSNILLVLGSALLLGGFANINKEQKFNRGDEDGDHNVVVVDDDDEKPVIGFWSAFTWLVGMTLAIALLSEYIVGTIEDASSSWGISISFLSIILLPILGNAAEHAGAIIFAFKNKLDISLGVALGSATQISMFVVPLCVIVAWITDVGMDLELGVIETGSLALSIIILAFVLQDGTSHYMKGLVLLLCYVLISACFFLQKSPNSLGSVPSAGLIGLAAA